MSESITIKDVRTYAISKEGGGDYHLQEKGHWITDTYIANPMSMYPKYKKSRQSWGIGVLGSIVVEIELSNGIVGVATGLGGEPACWLIQNHFKSNLGSNVQSKYVLWKKRYNYMYYKCNRSCFVGCFRNFKR